jgi:hypothetical protein
MRAFGTFMTRDIQIYRFRHDLRASFRRDLGIYVTVIVCATLVYFLSEAYGTNYDLAILGYSKLFLSMGACYLVGYLAVYFVQLASRRHPRPLLAYWDKLKSLLSSPHEVIALVVLMGVLSIGFAIFTYLKSMIPVIVPYQYDPIFAEIDRLFHFGIDPWKITHAIFGHPFATSAISFFYNLWFVFCWFVLLFFMLRVSEPQLRNRYLVSFLFCWIIIGGLLATLMSSAGPCFYLEITNGNKDFLPLMALLTEQQQWLQEYYDFFAIWSVDTQRALWEIHSQRQAAIGGGISAMPSMHVSTSVLMALGIGRVNKKLAIFFWAYVAVIQIGSVHLAWHYAIDGYLAAVLTLLIWKLTAIRFK